MSKPATGISYSSLFEAYLLQPFLKRHAEMARSIYPDAEARVQYVYNAVMHGLNLYERARGQFLCSVIGGCHGSSIEIPHLLTGRQAGSGEGLDPVRLNKKESMVQSSPTELLARI